MYYNPDIIIYIFDAFAMNNQMALPEKVVLDFIPAVGACFSISNIIFLWKKEHDGHFVEYHKWFYSCSELVVWVSFLVFSCQLQCTEEFNAFNFL